MWSVLSARVCSSKNESADLASGRWNSGNDRTGPPGSSRRYFAADGSTHVAIEMTLEMLLAEYVLWRRRIHPGSTVSRRGIRSAQQGVYRVQGTRSLCCGIDLLYTMPEVGLLRPANTFKGLTNLSEDNVLHASWSARRMYVGHFEYRPHRLESVQINCTDMFVILVGRVHGWTLRWPLNFDYITVGTISSGTFVKLDQTGASTLQWQQKGC